VIVASDAAVVLDYMRVLVWPVLVLAALAYAARRYGDHIGRLIDRIRHVRALGTELGFSDAPQQELAAAEEAAEELADARVGPIAAMYEQELEAQALEAQAERTQLLRLVAVKDIQLDYERIHRIIYGSQIAALRALRSGQGGTLSRADLEPHLARSKSLWTAVAVIQNLTFEQWIGYLASHGLVEATAGIAAAAAGGAYRITPKGEGYLDYIDVLGLPTRIL
jgi:hypothetical protein